MEIISSYTRAQAIEDGELVDVSEMAKEAGIKYPVALTRAVWFGCVDVPEGLEGEQDEAGRLWDVLSMFRFAAATSKAGVGEMLYRLYVLKRSGRKPELVTLKAHIGPGDDWHPVITIMEPEED